MFGLNIVIRFFCKFLKIVFKVFKLWIPALGFALLLILTSLFHIEDGTFGNVFSVIVLAPFAVAWVLGMLQSIIRIAKKDFTWGDLFSGLSLPGLPGNKDRVGFKSKEKGVSADQLNGIVVGKKGNKYIQQDVNEDGHVMVCGGSGSGKSTGIIIPTLQRWAGRAFYIDIKPELYDASKKAQARMVDGRSNVMVFDPSDNSTFGYDPLYMVRNSDNPSQAAHMIADILIPLPTGNTDPVWARGGQSLFVAGILYYLKQRPNISFAELIEEIRIQPVADLINMIMNESDEYKLAKMEISDKVGADEKTLASFASELQTLSIFASDTQLVSALNNSRPVLTPDDLENHDVCIRIQESKLDVWSKLLALVTAQFLKYFEMKPNNAGQSTLFCIDETPRLGRINGLQNALATLRSRRVKVLLVCQSVSQLNEIYGKEVTKALFDNCSRKVILKSTEPETQDYLSKMVGTAYQKVKSRSANSDVYGMSSGGGISVSEQERRIIKPEEFAYLQDELIYLSPQGYSRLKKIKCWQEKEFAQYMS